MSDPLEVHVYLHLPPDPRIDEVLTAVQQLQSSVAQQGVSMALDLSQLTAAAAANENAEQSAILLMQQLGAELTAAINGGDQTAVNAVADALNNESATLAAAVVQNTPAASTPPAGSGPTAPPADTGTPPADGTLTTSTVTGTAAGTTGIPGAPGVPEGAPLPPTQPGTPDQPPAAV